MEWCKKKAIIRRRCRFIKEWSYALSLTIFFSTFVYATWIHFASPSPQNLSEATCLLTVKAADNWFKNSERNKIREMVNNVRVIVGGSRRLLGGPGSSPPRCSLKCGRCKPCKPVRVSVPPGTPVTAEYYPEAWRCKCGNKLYMP
ncbi:hypothetical protein CASFOL_005607 [Castilleja foliolosa]|uniref:Epidermal patterning factor-like protein n=1 Tax=Castilleja foliolosa TaxID=1961234 RepID=A0ABD3E7X9_9LAMI